MKCNRRKTHILIITCTLILAAGGILTACQGKEKTRDIRNYTETVSRQPVSMDDIPAYDGEASITIEDNVPDFSEEDKKSTEAFEYYSDLDELGRCGEAYANICKEQMPTEERQGIGQVKPSGWQTVKYNELIEGNYLYNRCHLIGYQLAGENANEKNLITGTRYLNITGMLEFENMVAEYVEETNHHVLYRVTPHFEGTNLVADGVRIEAWSVEDDGEGICFDVFCYNVQPGIEIDYANGNSWVSEESTQKEARADLNQEEREYVLNLNTRKIHLPDCSSVSDMSWKNKKVVKGTMEKIQKKGYTPCKNCLGQAGK